jgi:hypothetical protein
VTHDYEKAVAVPLREKIMMESFFWTTKKEKMDFLDFTVKRPPSSF